MRALAVGLLAVATLLVAGSASASEQRPTMPELEREIMCPTCKTPLSMSDAPAADRIRVFIRREIGAGRTKSEIKDQLVVQFGEAVLAAPPARGFNLLAWALPLGGGLAAALILAFLARSWLSTRQAFGVPEATNGRAPVLDRDLERRLDAELASFDG